MNIESVAHAQVAVSFLPKLNSTLSLPLVERCGGMEGFFREREQVLDAIFREHRIEPGLFNRERALKDAWKELQLIERHDIRFCTIEDNAYPDLLRHCEDVPLILYYKGDLSSPADREKFLAVVGTRKASVRCQERVGKVLEELSGMGHRPVVVSGLAYGIDASAHRASLKCGLRTWAVGGIGLHSVYPSSHKTLAESILSSNGALISEFPCSTAVHPGNFLKRNRIVAGLCHATLVAESAIKGGSMATARMALSYNREVMAFPGRPDDTYSAGCNLLIKENVAALVENGLDVARILGYPEKQPQPQQVELDLFGEEGQKHTVLAILDREGEVHIDELQARTGIGMGELSAVLLQLELEGKVVGTLGQQYTRIL